MADVNPFIDIDYIDLQAPAQSADLPAVADSQTLPDVKSLQVGTENTCFKADESGIWLGRKTFAEAKAVPTFAVEASTGKAYIGGLETKELHIPDSINVDSMHVESDGDTYWGCTPADFAADNERAKALIRKNGDAKFKNVDVSGTIRTAVFKKDTISAVNGSVQINQGADCIEVDMTALDTSTLISKGDVTFANGDILRIKDGVNDEWLEVVSSASLPSPAFLQPAVAVNDDSIGTIPWANPDNIKTSNNVYSTNTISGTAGTIGATAISRGGVNSAGYTMLARGNIATFTGVITSIEIFFEASGVDGAGVKIGTFYGSGANWTMRDSVTIGAVTKGSKQTFTGLNMQVVAGDVIGIYCTAGMISYAANPGYNYLLGDQFTAGLKTYNIFGVGSSTNFGIYGQGYTVTSNYLKANNFGFNIPSNATITGIRVKIEGKATGTVKDNTIKLIKPSGILGITNKSIGAIIPTTEASASYGGAGDLFGETWTFADINNANFGVVYAVNGSGVAYVDNIEISIYYTSPSVVYTVNRDKAAVYTTNLNPAWKKGTTIVNYGASGEGFIEMLTSATNSPYLRIATHTGTPWVSDDTKVILGQLKNKTGNDEYGLWIKSGAAYIGGYRLFEAVIDPAGLGDYATIQEAITAGKKRLFLRNGVHILSADLTLSADDVSLTGESREGAIIQSGVTEGASAYVINISGARCNLSNLTRTGLSSSSYFPINITGSDCLIQNSVIKNGASGMRGIQATTGAGFKIQNCRIEASIWPIYTTQDQTFILDNYINVANGNNTGFYLGGNGGAFSRNRYTRAGTGQYGIQLEGTNWNVGDNFVYSSSTAGGTAIYVSGSMNKIINNRVQGFYNGIQNSANYGISICNNSILNVGNNGININSSAGAGYGHHVTSNNTLYNIGGNGISIQYGYGQIITNNTLYNVAYNGIYADITVGFHKAVITGNQAFYCNNGFLGYATGTAHQKCVWANNMSYACVTRGFNIVCGSSNIIGNIDEASANASIFTSGGGNVAYNIG